MMYFWCTDSQHGPFFQLIVQQVDFEGLWWQAQHFPSDELAASWSWPRGLTCSWLLHQSSTWETRDPHSNLTLPLTPCVTLGKSLKHKLTVSSEVKVLFCWVELRHTWAFRKAYSVYLQAEVLWSIPSQLRLESPDRDENVIPGQHRKVGFMTHCSKWWEKSSQIKLTYSCVTHGNCSALHSTHYIPCVFIEHLLCAKQYPGGWGCHSEPETQHPHPLGVYIVISRDVINM